MKKIVIIGCGGGGKSTLAKKLAAKLSLPLYHLDRYFWKAGWQEIDPKEFLEFQHKLISQEQWIIDGNAMRTISVRLHAADTIIFLDISRWQCIYNVICRQWRDYGKEREDMGVGCTMRFDKNFWRFLWYIWCYNKRFKPSILQNIQMVKGHCQVYHLRSYTEVDQFLKSIVN